MNSTSKMYSNTMWHAGCKMLRGGSWIIAYQDDASRFVPGHGVFARATAANALAVLDAAIDRYGTPMSILASRALAPRAAEPGKAGGGSRLEERLEDLGIRHIKAGAMHPRTNGKINRLYGEMGRKLRLFEASSARTTRGAGGPASHVGGPFHAAPAADPVDRFFYWFNFERPSMALDRSRRKTPAMAFRRMLPVEGDDALGDLAGQGGYE